MQWSVGDKVGVLVGAGVGDGVGAEVGAGDGAGAGSAEGAGVGTKHTDAPAGDPVPSAQDKHDDAPVLAW